MSARKLTNIKNNDIQTTMGKYSAKNIFKSYITVDELKRHPELYPSLKPSKKLILDVLSQNKPKIINIKGVQNENKTKLVSRLNSFYKVFFNYYKQQKNSSEDTNILNQENKDFLKKYKKSNKSNEINKNQNHLNEIKEQYKKKNYYVSNFDNDKKNLFNGNILLSNKKELKNYILYDLGSPISNDKSISFLHKLNKKLGDKTSEKALNLIYSRLNMDKYNNDKIEMDNEKVILDTKKDIMNLQETMDSMHNIDDFFNLDNKNYLNSLQNDDNDRKSSAKISMRYNSANIIQKENENEKNQKNNNIALKKKNKKGIAKKKKKELIKPSLDNIDINNLNKNKYIKQQTKTYGNYDNRLENLYDKMSTKENLLMYQPEIKDYLENKKFDVSIKLTPSIVCNNFEKTREKICTSDFLKNNIQLRKQMGNVESKIEQINDNDIKAINKMNNIEDKMIKLFCDINNPKPKE